MKKALFAGIILFTMLLIQTPASANITSDMAAGLPLGQVLGNAVGPEADARAVQAAIAEMVRQGADVEALVSVALGSGFTPDDVIAGALSGGADLSAVLHAVITAGVEPRTAAVAARNAGADSDSVAAAIASEGMDFASSGGSGDGIRTDSGIPFGGGGGGGADVSGNR